MLRKKILENYTDQPILDAVYHNFSIHLVTIFHVLWKLVALYLLYQIIGRQMPNYIYEAQIIISSLGFLVMVKFCISFFNSYLDAIVFTRWGINIFLRESFLEYKMDIFERDNTQVVSFQQNNIRDKLFNKWDIYIALANNYECTFDNIPYPQKQVNKIMEYKNKYQTNYGYSKDTEKVTNNKENFDALVETLGEVIVDYMSKNKNKKDDVNDDRQNYN